MAKVDHAVSKERLTEFLVTQVNPVMRNRAFNRFANEGDDAVGKWEPLKKRTEWYRSQQGYPPKHPINVRTGQLRAWMYQTGMLNHLGTDTVELAFPNHPHYGVDLDAKFEGAQLGKPGKQVPRPVLGFNETDFEQISLAFARWFVGVIG